MSDDRLSELRELITSTMNDVEQLRQEQLQLLPALRARKASMTEIAAAFGISRAAFYKNGYDKISVDDRSENVTSSREELLEHIRELEARRAELIEHLPPWRRERDEIILRELQADERPKWAELSARAGVSEEWLSRVKSGKNSRQANEGIRSAAWQRLLAAPRRNARLWTRGEIPTSPGVYLWLRDELPVYIGEAKGSTGLQGRLSAHLALGNDLSRSTLRASVAVAQLGVDRRTARARPSVMNDQQIEAVNDWLSGCELGWIECGTGEEAHDLEVALRAAWLPSLNLI